MIAVIVLLCAVAFVLGMWCGWVVHASGVEMDKKIDRAGLGDYEIIHIPTTGVYTVSPPPARIEYLGPKGSGNERQSGG